MQMTKTTLARGMAVAALAFATAVTAAVPTSLSQQGRLLNSNGTPATGSVSLTFTVYDSQTSTTSLWTESQTVALVDGYFAVQLGKSTPFAANLWTGSTPLFLGVKVGMDPEMTPREELA